MRQFSCYQDAKRLILATFAGLALFTVSAAANPLFDAISASQSAKVAQLIKAGENVNAVNRDGETPLMVAAMRGNREVVSQLLAAKADVNLKSDTGYTALLWAAFYGYGDVVKQLLAARADVTPVAIGGKRKGKTAMEIARENGELVTALLLSRMKDQYAVR